MDSRPRDGGVLAGRDTAVDLVVVVLLVVGAAGWGGLLLGLAGRFSAAGIALLAAGGALVGWIGRPRPPRETEGAAAGAATPRQWGGLLETLAVFAVAAAVLLPGYDVSLYGADATVYRGIGIHLGRTGSLVVDDPLLADLSPPVVGYLFPFSHAGVDFTRLRSAAGLGFFDGTTRVWSNFSQLPSVWLAIGWLVGGPLGEQAATPLLGAAALTAFWLLLRRYLGLATAALATGLLAVMLPEVFIARLGLAEIPGQWLLWGAILALARWEATRALAPALAAGLGLGLLGMVRPEYLAFVPIAAGIAWLVPGRRLALPVASVIVAGLAWGTGVVLLAVVVPSHYRLALRYFVTPPWAGSVVHAVPPAVAVGIAGIVLVAGVVAAMVAVRRLLSGSTKLARRVCVVAIAVWGALFFMSGRSASSGQMFSVLATYTAWPVLVIGGAGLLPLFRACWQAPALRLGLLVGAVAAAHFAIDLHAAATPVWAGRRLLPAVLPLFCAGVAAGVTAIGRRVSLAGLACAALALGTTAVPTIRAIADPWFDGASAWVAEISALVPRDSVALLDPSLRDTLLEVSLWLEQGRPTVQLPGVAGDLDLPLVVSADVAPRRVALIRNALLPEPELPVATFTPLGNATLRVRAPTGEHTGRASLLPVRVYEVRPRMPSP